MRLLECFPPMLQVLYHVLVREEPIGVELRPFQQAEYLRVLQDDDLHRERQRRVLHGTDQQLKLKIWRHAEEAGIETAQLADESGAQGFLRNGILISLWC